MPAALPVLKLKVVNPLEAVAVNVIGPTPTFTGDAGLNVTVWLCIAVGVTLFDGADGAPAPKLLAAVTVNV